MSSLDTLTDRIRSEFRELPGLKITFQQACRLWHSNEAQCLAALEALISEGFLTRSASGAFIALPRPQGKSAKVAIPDAATAIRCPHCQHLNYCGAGQGMIRWHRCAGCSRIITERQASA
jgi:phage FluMu protein Com